jgi:hypothetical protein
MERVGGIVEVWRTDDTHEVVINHPALKLDSNGMGKIVLPPRSARHLAHLLIEHAADAEFEANPAGGNPADRKTEGSISSSLLGADFSRKLE